MDTIQEEVSIGQNNDLDDLHVILSYITEEKLLQLNSISCSVCQNNFELNGELAESYCGHFFHINCLGRWLGEVI